MHITEILIEKGYKPYRRLIKDGWNKEIAYATQMKMDRHKGDILFEEGDFNSKESVFYVHQAFNPQFHKASYNTQENGGLRVYFLKDEDYTKPFIYGLNESNTITLMSPRPKIRYIHFNRKFCKTMLIMNEDFDDAMNYCLKVEKHEDILDAISEGKTLKYDTVFGKYKSQLIKNHQIKPKDLKKTLEKIFKGGKKWSSLSAEDTEQEIERRFKKWEDKKSKLQ